MTMLIPSIIIPLEDLVTNMNGAHTYAAAYFNPTISSSVPLQDLACAINFTHTYLVQPFLWFLFSLLFANFLSPVCLYWGSHSPRPPGLWVAITLCLEVCKLTAMVPPTLQQPNWHSWAISQEEHTHCSVRYLHHLKRRNSQLLPLFRPLVLLLLLPHVLKVMLQPRTRRQTSAPMPLVRLLLIVLPSRLLPSGNLGTSQHLQVMLARVPNPLLLPLT